jgi:predicted dehydrogenase
MKVTEQKHILIIGSGSVGRRHAVNFKKLGVEISAFDPRPDRLDELNREVGAKRLFGKLCEALDGNHYDAAIVASPTSFHVEQSMELISRKIPVLLEKPLSKDLKTAKKLAMLVKENNTPILLGYTWRWWEPLIVARRMILEGEIGRIIHVRMSMAAHLADWHPWEQYQDFFMASKELGGGALLDESHWIDLMIWFFGMPDAIFASIDRIGALEIETDDNVDMLAFYKSGIRVSLHLDLNCRPHEKTILFSGEKGSLKWTADPNGICLGKTWENKWDFMEFKCQRNDMFVAEAKDFLEVVAGTKTPQCTIDDGLKVMRVIASARKSSELGVKTDVIQE